MGLSTVKIFLATLLFLMPALILSQSSAKPQQFTPEKLAQSLKTNKFTLVYFYSTTYDIRLSKLSVLPSIFA